MNIRVLLTDDHEVFVKQVRRLIGKAPGIQVVGIAADGIEAVRLARKLAHDIVVIDISMPRLNALKPQGRLRRKCR